MFTKKKFSPRIRPMKKSQQQSEGLKRRLKLKTSLQQKRPGYLRFTSPRLI
jgi:hypothetical protein